MRKESKMTREEQANGLDPQVAFSLDAIIAAEAEREMDEVPFVDTEVQLKAEFKLHPGDVIVDAYREVTGVEPAKAPAGKPHSLFPAAGAGSVIYFLEQLRPWLSTVADLAQLGALGVLILQKVREKLESDRRAVVFSQEIVEGMCLRRLEEGLGTELGKALLRAHAFDRRSGEPVAPQYRMSGTGIYLVWIRIEGSSDIHLFLVDAWGKVWGEWHE
jgi:hypothetical protein